MASSTIDSGSVVTYTIKVDGTAIPDTWMVWSIIVEKRINKISAATITILDGDAETGEFDASSSDTLAPGAKITIEAGYDSTNETIFSGIITAQALRIDDVLGSALEVECRDEAIKMVVGRKCITYSKQKDSDVIAAIIGTYSGLSSDVQSTTTQWPEQIQYYVTDWDFMVSRAEANAMIVSTEGGKVSVFKPSTDTTSVLDIEYGDGLLEFNATLDAVNQLGNVKATTWDYKTQALISAQSASSLAGPGNLTSKKLSEVVGLDDYALQTAASLASYDLTGWTEAQLVKSDYSKIRGTVKFQGNATPLPGKYITLSGVGKRFNGDYLIPGVQHSISDGNWFTGVTLGLSNNWFIEEPDVMAPPASGLLPGARGLVNATVKKIYEDPDSQYRILVDIPTFDKNGAGVWARLTNFYSTSGAGVFFLPEVGDEVILGFLNEDPRYPIILGSVYSSSKLKPFTGLDPEQKNSLKAIVSKSGISIEFNDDKKIFTITTPDKNKMIFSDDEKKITIQDEHSNSITMSGDGIVIKSATTITMEADQTITLKGTQGINVQSSGGDVATQGLNIKENADMQYTAEGAQMAQVSSGMQLTLKSAMVMIN